MDVYEQMEQADQQGRAEDAQYEAGALAERARVLAIVRAVLLGVPVPHSLTTACAEIEQRASAAAAR